jgi:hypothetical protein
MLTYVNDFGLPSFFEQELNQELKQKPPGLVVWEIKEISENFTARRIQCLT